MGESEPRKTYGRAYRRTLLGIRQAIADARNASVGWDLDLGRQAWDEATRKIDGALAEVTGVRDNSIEEVARQAPGLAAILGLGASLGMPLEAEERLMALQRLLEGRAALHEQIHVVRTRAELPSRRDLAYGGRDPIERALRAVENAWDPGEQIRQIAIGAFEQAPRSAPKKRRFGVVAATTAGVAVGGLLAGLVLQPPVGDQRARDLTAKCVQVHGAATEPQRHPSPTAGAQQMLNGWGPAFETAIRCSQPGDEAGAAKRVALARVGADLGPGLEELLANGSGFSARKLDWQRAATLVGRTISQEIAQHPELATESEVAGIGDSRWLAHARFAPDPDQPDRVAVTLDPRDPGAGLMKQIVGDLVLEQKHVKSQGQVSDRSTVAYSSGLANAANANFNDIFDPAAKVLEELAIAVKVRGNHPDPTMDDAVTSCFTSSRDKVDLKRMISPKVLVALDNAPLVPDRETLANSEYGLPPQWLPRSSVEIITSDRDPRGKAATVVRIDLSALGQTPGAEEEVAALRELLGDEAFVTVTYSPDPRDGYLNPEALIISSSRIDQLRRLPASSRYTMPARTATPTVSASPR